MIVTFRLLTVLFALWFGLFSCSEAGTASDEASLRSLYVCSRAFKEMPKLAYDADIAKLDRITAAVHAELEKKYSTRDVDLMKAKASTSADKETVKEYHFKFCSEMMTDLQNNRNSVMKSYLLKSE